MINCLSVLGLQQIGCRAPESGILLTFLNLPHAHRFHGHLFWKIESAMSLKVKEIYEKSMNESIEEDVQLTIKRGTKQLAAKQRQKYITIHCLRKLTKMLNFKK